MKTDLTKLQSKLGSGRSVIGLHIGTSSINAVQVADHKGRATLIKAAVEKISLKEGEDTDAAISSALRSALLAFSFRRAVIVCTFHDPQVFVRKITTPPMPLQELGPAVGLAVKNVFPFSLNDAFLDFRLVGNASGQGKERLDVLVAACPVKVIERIRALFSARKIAPGLLQEKSVDKKIAKLGHIKVGACIPAAIAMANLIGRSKSKTDETLAVILLGSAVTELTIFRNSSLEFSRRLSVTAEDITQSMTGAFYSDTGKTEITVQEAQDIRKEYGIPDPDASFLINAKISSQQIFMLVKPKIEQLATEINRSFEYYLEELHGTKVDRVVLVGEAAQLKRLDVFLSKELGLDVAQSNPAQGVPMLDPSLIRSDADAHLQVLAIGAALGNLQGINLFSKGLRKGDQRNTELKVLKVLTAIAVAAVIFSSVFLSYQIHIKSKQTISKEQSLASQLKKARDILATRRLREERPLWGGTLKVFSSMPQDIYLNELNLDKGQLHIKGVVLVEGEGSKTAIGNFIADLRKDVFKDAHLKFSKKLKDEAGQSEFEIVTAIEMTK